MTKERRLLLLSCHANVLVVLRGLWPALRIYHSYKIGQNCPCAGLYQAVLLMQKLIDTQNVNPSNIQKFLIVHYPGKPKPKIQYQSTSSFFILSFEKNQNQGPLSKRTVFDPLS